MLRLFYDMGSPVSQLCAQSPDFASSRFLCHPWVWADHSSGVLAFGQFWPSVTLAPLSYSLDVPTHWLRWCPVVAWWVIFDNTAVPSSFAVRNHHGPDGHEPLMERRQNSARGCGVNALGGWRCRFIFGSHGELVSLINVYRLRFH